jgi:UDP-GlcNAc:undecaprenyl-phosphate GlcNAc-1-phosphate transferase
MNTLHVINPLAALFVTYLLIPVLRKVAKRINLVDKPQKRKIHSEPVPLVGGVSIFIATTLILGLSLPFQLNLASHLNLFVATFILLLMGVIDDRFDLSAVLKLVIQIFLAHYVVMQGIKIESLLGIFGIFELMPWAQYLLTVVIITGVVNAINLMDGIDGLAAGLAVLSFVVLAILAVYTNHYELALVFLSIVGSLLAFIKFNFSSKQKIFMGDAGSLVLGFVIVVSGIYLIQSTTGTSKVSLVTLSVFAILLVPVLDALRVFRRRVKSGKSPFSADRTHLHHLILNIGLKHKMTTLAILIIVPTMMLLGYLGFVFFGFTFSVASSLLFFYLFTSLLQFHSKLLKWKNHIFEMEKNKMGQLHSKE